MLEKDLVLSADYSTLTLPLSPEIDINKVKLILELVSASQPLKHEINDKNLTFFSTTEKNTSERLQEFELMSIHLWSHNLITESQSWQLTHLHLAQRQTPAHTQEKKLRGSFLSKLRNSAEPQTRAGENSNTLYPLKPRHASGSSALSTAIDHSTPKAGSLFTRHKK